MRNLGLVRKREARSLNGLKFGISAKGCTVLRLSHGSLSPEQLEAARRVGSYECVSTEGGEVQYSTQSVLVHGFGIAARTKASICV